MPQTLDLSIGQKKRLRQLYLEGHSPTEICATCRSYNITRKQLLNLAYREGWQKLKSKVEESEKQSAQQALDNSRRTRAEEVAALIETAFDSLRRDSDVLKDGWGFVEDAAGASALMRAKKLLTDRLFAVAGLDAESEAAQPGGATINLIVARPIMVEDVADAPRRVKRVAEAGEG